MWYSACRRGLVAEGVTILSTLPFLVPWNIPAILPDDFFAFADRFEFRSVQKSIFPIRLTGPSLVMWGFP